MEGKAHELSEGDTFYLGACRKGSGGENESLQKQPYSTLRAKSRAFSFKQSYLSQLLKGHVEQSALLSDDGPLTIEVATLDRLRPLFGLSLGQISQRVALPLPTVLPKNFKADLIRRVLTGGDSVVPELEKSGVEVKTITLSSDNRPREHMSFPGFKFLDIINEDWWESSFCEKLEKKFLFVVFRQDGTGEQRLLKAGYWNMPYQDRMEAKRVWEDTKRRVAIDATDLPRASESHVAHVRPKARDGNDRIPTPQGGTHVKQCFWLNRDYIAAVLNKM
jgi:DNA mismatch repair protein MutH